MRSRRLAAKYEAFRAGFEARRRAIDAGFNQNDRVVKGIRWHYIDQGAPDGPVILFMHGLPEGWYSWHDVLPLIDPISPHRHRHERLRPFGPRRPEL